LQREYLDGEQAMDIQIVPVERDYKSVLRQLIELYLYDFSEYDDAEVDEHGWYGYDHLDHYWTEKGRHPFFIRVATEGGDGKLAGFVLVSGHTFVLDDPDAHSISEFFVMRKYRRRGVGRIAATQVFDLFPGPWEVDQHGGNRPSYLFWETVIGDYTGGRYSKQPLANEHLTGQAITFDNSQ
jgi:predicted acetyltransferase